VHLAAEARVPGEVGARERDGEVAAPGVGGEERVGDGRGEDLEQQRVRDAAVDDAGGAYTLRDGADAALNLGYHPTAYLPLRNHPPHP